LCPPIYKRSYILGSASLEEDESPKQALLQLGSAFELTKEVFVEWSISDHQDWRVVDFTRWLKLTNYQNLEERAGVYIFANVNHQVKYIGKAGAGRMVAEIGNAIRRDKDRGATLVKALYTNSTANAQSLETDLIRKYRPPNNFA